MLLVIFFLLNVLTLILSTAFNYFKSSETKKHIMRLNQDAIIKIVISVLVCVLFLIFVMNMNHFSQDSFSVFDLILINCSMVLFFSSIGIFSFTFHIPKLDILRLPYPSRARARAGTIKIGKIIYKNKKKYPFFLSMNDLQKHIF